jgi:hypothetical protein
MFKQQLLCTLTCSTKVEDENAFAVMHIGILWLNRVGEAVRDAQRTSNNLSC